MKKLSLIVALAVVLTVGGVFAAWNYYETDVTPIDTVGAQVSIDTATTATLGTLSATGNFNVFFTNVDETYDTKMNVTGDDITVTFTPTTSIGSPDFTGKVSVKATVTVASDIVSTTSDGVIDLGVIDCSTANRTVTFGATQLASVLSHTSVNLPTKADYDQFAGKVTATTITISISATKV